MKIYVFVLIFLFFMPVVIAVTPVTPVERTDALIKQEHEKTRAWCMQQWDDKEQYLRDTLDAEKQQFIKEAKRLMWFDRFVTIGALGVGFFLAGTLLRFFQHKEKRQLLILERQQKDYDVQQAKNKAKEQPSIIGDEG